MDYSSEKELFNDLKGALKVKLRMIKEKYDYISMLDIWNYLKLNKWRYYQNLNISVFLFGTYYFKESLITSLMPNFL